MLEFIFYSLLILLLPFLGLYMYILIKLLPAFVKETITIIKEYRKIDDQK